ncbi:uncharacterized protein HKW66_Vig0113350 [Vigna angularis]|uniref:Uncharacterized protein n=1 Tax=Phaseolus angularis TaxID=3914 RepID=A0A8T0L1X5_PHAAN|nr:uncharacterized protein HKW66_Vig0113350 [Vigna angularis]
MKIPFSLPHPFDGTPSSILHITVLPFPLPPPFANPLASLISPRTSSSSYSSPLREVPERGSLQGDRRRASGVPLGVRPRHRSPIATIPLFSNTRQEAKQYLKAVTSLQSTMHHLVALDSSSESLVQLHPGCHTNSISQREIALRLRFRFSGEEDRGLADSATTFSDVGLVQRESIFSSESTSSIILQVCASKVRLGEEESIVQGFRSWNNVVD